MTFRDLLNGLLNTELYEMLIWAKWYFRPSRVSCKECIERKAEGSGKAPDCTVCGLPTANLLKKYKMDKETSKCSK